jgi:hypothetical protein
MPILNDESDHSGVEINTPKKSLTLNPDELVTTVPGVGVIQTNWVGLKGKEEISKLVEDQRTQPLVKSLKNELSLLSRECLKAFEVTGLLASTDKQVQTAIDLCKKYTGSLKESKKPGGITNDRLQNLWSTTAEQPRTIEDSAAAATFILGKELVESITEEHREPPDVSYIDYFNYRLYVVSIHVL